MYVNKVGPYFNTHETYHYYSLPVCRPDKVGAMRAVTSGDAQVQSRYCLTFSYPACPRLHQRSGCCAFVMSPLTRGVCLLILPLLCLLVDKGGFPEPDAG